jgi:hypothetical protein
MLEHAPIKGPVNRNGHPFGGGQPLKSSVGDPPPPGSVISCGRHRPHIPHFATYGPGSNNDLKL